MSDPIEARVTIPDVVAEFRAYHRDEPSWGSLHIVLDDGNISDDNVRFCANRAREYGDARGERLAGLLLRMSRTQRRKLMRVARGEGAFASEHGPEAAAVPEPQSA